MDINSNNFSELGKAAQDGAGGFESFTPKVVGLTAVLETLGDSLESLARNPFFAATAMNRIGHFISKDINEALQKTNLFTAEQLKLLGQFSRVTPSILGVAGAFSSLAANVAKTGYELNKAGNELFRFTSLDRLPGGATTLRGAATYRARESAGMLGQYGQGYEEMFNKVRQALSSSKLEKRSNEVAMYQYLTGFDFVRNMEDVQSKFGMRGVGKVEAFKKFKGTAAYLMQHGVPEQETGQVLDILHRGALNLNEKTGINYDEAFNKLALTAIPLATKGGAGAENIGMLLNLLPNAAEPLTNIKRNALMSGGITPYNSGKEGDYLRYIMDIKKYANTAFNPLRPVDKNGRVSELNDMSQITNTPGLIEVKAKTEAMGLSMHDLFEIYKSHLDDMKDIDGLTKDAKDAMQKAVEGLTDFDKKRMKDLQGEATLPNKAEGFLQKLKIGAAEATGMSPQLVEGIGYGVAGLGAGGIYAAKKYMDYTFLKKALGNISKSSKIGVGASIAEDAAWTSSRNAMFGEEVLEKGASAESGILSKLFRGKAGKIGGITGAALLFALLSSKDTKGEALQAGARILATKALGFTGANLLLDPSVMGDATLSGPVIREVQRKISEGKAGTLTDEEISTVTRASGKGIKVQKALYDIKNEALSRRLNKTVWEGGIHTYDFMNTSVADATKTSYKPTKQNGTESKSDITGTLNVIFTNSKGEELASTSVDANASGGTQQVIRIALGGVTNGGFGG